MRVVPPVAKRLVCGDVGTGAMADVPTLIKTAHDACKSAMAARGTGVAAGDC